VEKSIEITINTGTDFELDPDHMHGDEAVPMDPIEVSSGQIENGPAWFRYVLACRRADCAERVVLLVRSKSTTDGPIVRASGD
jgi:hypothetical protein